MVVPVVVMKMITTVEVVLRYYSTLNNGGKSKDENTRKI